ncbi:MAG: hypothetical protein IJU95_07670 [Treponema sp.]|nr:hypothetical protein [Treponema sp.]
MSKEKNPSQTRHPIRKALITILFLLLLLSLASFLWFGYAKKDRASFLSAIPGDYSLILHTDNIWESAGPLLDLKSADSLLTDASLAGYRAAYLALRKSTLRQNKWTPLIAGRKAELAVYMDGENIDFIAVTDAGNFACITRLASVFLPFAKIEGLEYIKDGGYFIYKSVDKNTGSITKIYIKTRKNLIAASLSPSLLLKALQADHSPEHPEQAKNLLQSKSDFPFKIVMRAKSLVSKAVPPDNIYLASLISLLGEEAKSLVEFRIDDGEVQLEASIPLDGKSVTDSPLAPLLSKKSSTPAMLTRFPNNIQYYTLLHTGRLEELKDSLFPIVQQTQDIETAWAEGEAYAKKLFKSSIEELVFSWAGTEFALLGVDGSSDPVFVLQVGDE